MQLILGVFDFPERRSAGDTAVPELVVHRVQRKSFPVSTMSRSRQARCTAMLRS